MAGEFADLLFFELGPNLFGELFQLTRLKIAALSPVPNPTDREKKLAGEFSGVVDLDHIEPELDKSIGVS
jgi:hypothetical protein